MIPIDYSLIGRYLLAKENNVIIHLSRALSGRKTRQFHIHHNSLYRHSLINSRIRGLENWDSFSDHCRCSFIAALFLLCMYAFRLCKKINSMPNSFIGAL